MKQTVADDRLEGSIETLKKLVESQVECVRDICVE